MVRTRDFGGGPPPPPAKYNYLLVKNAEGKVGAIQIGELSSRPLRYDLTHPADATSLLVAAFREGTALASKIDAMHAKYSFRLMGTSDKDHDPVMRSDYAKARAMRESFDAHSRLVHDLVYGSNIAKESLLRSKMWAVRYGDPALVDAYQGGIKDPAERKKREPLQRCLTALAGATGAANEVRHLEEAKAEKAWRKRMTGVPEAQLTALDAENVAKIDDDIAKRKQQREDQLASTACKEP